MSDVDSEADLISDSSSGHSDQHDDGGEDSSILPAVRELCDQLRANDPRILDRNSSFVPFKYRHEINGSEYSEAERIEVFQALKENTQVKHIRLFLQGYTKRSAEAAAKYLESSQTLQSIDLDYGGNNHHVSTVISLLLQALSRNTSVTKLLVDTESVRFGCEAFKNF
jgi:hypothetical protein